MPVPFQFRFRPAFTLHTTGVSEMNKDNTATSGDHLPGSTWPWTVLLAAILFFGFALVYGTAAENFSYVAFDTNDAYFDADTFDTTRAMRELTFAGDMQKHLLFSPIASSLVKLVGTIFSLDQRASIVAAIAVLGALNVALVFLFLIGVLQDRKSACAYSVLYGMTIANLVIFSIPETYSVTNLFILAYLALLKTHWESLNVAKGLLLSSVAGVGALANPPLLSLVAIHSFIAWRTNGFRFAARLGFVGAVLAAGIYYFTAIILKGPEIGIQYPAYYFLRWASIGHLFDPQAYVHVLVTFLVISVIAPVSEIDWNIELAEIGGYAASPILAITVIVWTALVAASCIGVFRMPGVYLRAILVWIALLMGFYVLFFPWGAILYSPQVLVPLVMIVATFGSEKFGRWNWRVAAVLSVAIAVCNLPLVIDFNG